jgi:N-hydroxyarylamine O-acetyltransferase
MATIDLDAYFQRIGYEGRRAATPDTLRDLVARHTESIPFENLDPLLRRPVRLDPASLERKLVRDRRGGYCYEQNTLFRHALEALGFPVIGLAARVLWNQPDGVVPPRSHMLLAVQAGGETYLADVGFGGQSPTAPLRLAPEVVQETPHEPFRLVVAGEEYVLQAKLPDGWRPLYRFDLREAYPSDYEVANWHVSTHPDSIFVNGLIVGRPGPGRRHTLFNNELAVHTRAGTERRVLTDPAELRASLTGVFGLALPDAPELDAVLARLTATDVR